MRGGHGQAPGGTWARVTKWYALRDLRIRALTREDLKAATALCARAWAYDHVTQTLLHEKVFEDPPGEASAASGAWEGDTLVGFVALCSDGRTAWIKIAAAEPARRYRGIASALLAEAEGWATKVGVRSLRLMDHPGNYLTPGMDVRYAEALEFLARRGFTVAGENKNLVVPLPPTAATRSAPSNAAGEPAYELRRARLADGEALARLARSFAVPWGYEVERAMDQSAPLVHVASQRGELVAFAAHGGNNGGTGAFGPAGTLVGHRGRGLGQTLLRACLTDIGKAGHAGAIIPWVSNTSLYARLGAIEGARYRVLTKAL